MGTTSHAPDTSRRRFLAGLGLASALPVAAAVPALAISTPAENPDLLALSLAFDRAHAAFTAADAAAKVARERFAELCPAIPPEMVLSQEELNMGFSGWRPRDLEGAAPPGCVLHFARHNLAGLKGLRLDVEEEPARTKMGRLARRKLKAVEAYEAGREEALRVSGLEGANLARSRALWDLEEAGNAIAKAPALTVAGLQIKARAFSGFLAVSETSERYRVGGFWGPALAAATLAVTGAA